VPIYRVRGSIPTLGVFEAERIELPLGPDTDLFLGADWMREIGLLDSIEKKLGIIKDSAESRDEGTIVEARDDYEDRQDTIDDIMRCASVRMDRSWTPFRLRGQPSSQVNSPLARQTKHENLGVELASARKDVQEEEKPRVPDEYSDFDDVFAETTPSDDFKLPPHREGFDHAIEIFHQSALELATTKEQTDTYLQKGLVGVSQS
ncbi:hypothetical protein V1527DRAFT_384293, partial [Lipomyces starkeyi]